MGTPIVNSLPGISRPNSLNASPEGMPLWGPNRFWPGSGLVLRCLGPGFTVLALGPGFRPIIIIIIKVVE